MLYSLFEDFAETRKDDINTTVDEVMNRIPLHDAVWELNFRDQLKGILSDLYDRASGQGRYLEIMDPS